MIGCVFVIDFIEIVDLEKEEEENPKEKQEEKVEMKQEDVYGPFPGQLMASIKQICRRAFLAADPRIVEGMYKCSLQATQDTYGIVYTLIDKYRGQVINEDCTDDETYILDILVPLVESSNFTMALTTRCQGMTYPQLVFHGFEINNEDPFFIPIT
jgi:ribosome assembly protein 1